MPISWKLTNSYKRYLLQTDYTKNITGSSLLAKRIVDALHEQGIEAVIKDEAESARLSGFASSMRNTVELSVNKDDLEKSKIIIDAMDKNPPD